MTRLAQLMSVLALLMVAMSYSAPVLGQDSDLADLLRERDPLPSELKVVDEGTRTIDEIASTFPDPPTTRQRLESWGWQENEFLDLAPLNDATSDLTMAQVSVHRFASDAGAADALAYFLAERATGLGLRDVPGISPGDESRAIEGAVGREVESTIYARIGATVVRVTVRQDDAAAVGTASRLAMSYARSVAEAISGIGHYISPQFGYEIEWRKSFWTRAESSSLPGVRDELILYSDDATLLYRAEVASPHAQPSSDSVRLPDGRGLVTRTIVAPAGSWAGPLPPGIVSEDWAAAIDEAPSLPPPWGLDTIPRQALSADRIAQAAPPVAGRLVLADTTIVGPPGHWNVWALQGGPSIVYRDPNDESVRAEILIDDVTPGATANEAIRFIFNLGFFAGRFAERGIQDADLRRDAQVPHFLTGSPDAGYQLLFGTRQGDWVVTIRAQTREDLEVLVRALVTGLVAHSS